MEGNSKQAIDIDFLSSIVDGDKNFEQELFDIFIDNAKRNIQKMTEANLASDNNSWYMASHAFKGASASIGAFDLANILERAQKNPEENSVKKSELLEMINAEFQLVLQSMNEINAQK